MGLARDTERKEKAHAKQGSIVRVDMKTEETMFNKPF